MARFRRLFRRLDTDKSGYITAEDLKTVVTAVGAEGEVTEEQIHELIASADKSGDGRVSYEEFVQAVIALYNESDPAIETQ